MNRVAHEGGRRVADESVEAGIKIDQRPQVVTDTHHPFGQQREPPRRRHDDRHHRRIGDGEEGGDAKEGRQRRRHPATLEPFEQRHQRDRDHQSGRHRQEEARTGAQGERQGDHHAHAGEQGDCGEQAIAAQGFGGATSNRAPQKPTAQPLFQRHASPRISPTLRLHEAETRRPYGRCDRNGECAVNLA